MSTCIILSKAHFSHIMLWNWKTQVWVSYRVGANDAVWQDAGWGLPVKDIVVTISPELFTLLSH